MTTNDPTIILACSGPALRDIDLAAQPHPICAISTAIQFLPRPHYWAFVDRPNREYGPDEGWEIMADQFVRKVCPAYIRDKTHRHIVRNITYVPYSDGLDARQRRFLDGGPALLRMTHKSILFAVQWFALNGWTRLVFAGCNLLTDIVDPYCWEVRRTVSQQKVDQQNTDHRQIAAILREWQPIARQRGIEFLSWTPDSPINDFMEPFMVTAETR